ncbi:hypothetical protein I0C86_41165 [Plantactinospora sp. S1510]|uniref:Uncharacterized protein n=1 Tax=Plantactinospora alkalitolerans TaxID=2789879 RepID=A0ABS0HAP4_9ACTN|nr:hypothetical protein [Plantactinospora alkalitolerans]MBF9135263.1 hypothetical protein [Plantactinospora alkalitolerans]
MDNDGRLIVLGSGDEVYVFRADQRDTANQMSAVLDVARPAGDVDRYRVPEGDWVGVLAKLERAGATVIDCREGED